MRSSLKSRKYYKKRPVTTFCSSFCSGKKILGRHKSDRYALLLLQRCAERGDFDSVFAIVKDRFDSIIAGLGLSLDLSAEYEHIKWAILHHAGRDYAASRGEYLNGMILAEYLGYDFIDPADYIKFCDDGSFDAETTNGILSEEMKKHENGVIPGFYGSHRTARYALSHAAAATHRLNCGSAQFTLTYTKTGRT